MWRKYGLFNPFYIPFIGVNDMTVSYVRKPEWLKIKLNTNEEYTGLKKMMREKNYIQSVKKRNVLIFMNAGLYVKRQHL